MMGFQNLQDLARLDIYVQEELSLKIPKLEQQAIFALQAIIVLKELPQPLLAQLVLFEMLLEVPL